MAIDAISREKAEALIRKQLTNTIQQDVPKNSIVMQLGTRLANMTSNQTKIPVLSMLPLAYWVNGDTGMKQTSKQEWDNVYMTAAELAVIVPVPEAVLADSTFDIMGEVQPRVREAMGAKIDNAILFGGERPAEWTTDVLTLAAKNKVTGPIDYAKLLGKDGLFSKVEAGGFGVDAVVGDRPQRQSCAALWTPRAARCSALTCRVPPPTHWTAHRCTSRRTAALTLPRPSRSRATSRNWCIPSVRMSP